MFGRPHCERWRLATVDLVARQQGNTRSHNAGTDLPEEPAQWRPGVARLCLGKRYFICAAFLRFYTGDGCGDRAGFHVAPPPVAILAGPPQIVKPGQVVL